MKIAHKQVNSLAAVRPTSAAFSAKCGSDSRRPMTTLPCWISACFRSLRANLSVVVVQDQRLSWVEEMSAPASGTSKAAHSDVAAKKKKGPGALATAYLVFYNVVMTAG